MERGNNVFLNVYIPNAGSNWLATRNIAEYLITMEVQARFNEKHRAS